MFAARVSHPRARSERLLVLVWVPLSLLMGLFTALNPALGLAAFLALAAAYGFSRSGTFAVCAFISTVYFESFASYTGEQLSPTKLAGAVLIVVALAALAVRVYERRPVAGGSAAVDGSAGVGVLAVPAFRFRAAMRVSPPPAWLGHPVIVGLLAAFLVVAVSSAVWAVDVTQVKVLSQRLVTDALIFLAVGVFFHRPQQLRSLGWTLLGAATASTLYGIALSTQSFERMIGGFYDPNDFAAAIVPAVALGLVVCETSASGAARWAGRVASIICMYGLLGSESRGALLALAVALVVLVWTSRGIERVRMLGVTSLLVAAGTLMFLLTPMGASLGERITSGDTSGRTDLWRVALYEFADEPIHGVGLGNYPVVSREYLRPAVVHTELFVSLQRTTHNTGLEVLAELGLLGLLTFGGFVAGSVGVLARALRQARRLHPLDAARYVPLGRGLLAATLAALATGIFLSGQYQELLWVLLGSGVAYAAMVQRCAGRDRAATASS